MIKISRNLSKLKKEKEAIKDRKTRGIKNLFEQWEEDCYKTVRVGIFIATVKSNMKIMVIEIN